MKTILYVAAAAAAVVPATAMAGGGQRTETGTTSTGLQYTATSYIVGQTGTGTAAAGGNPIYYAPNQSGNSGKGYSGSVALLMTYSNGSGFVCSGSLMSSGRVLTAAHCVSDGYRAGAGGVANGLVRTQVMFYDGVSQGVDPFFYPVNAAGQFGAGITAIDVAGYNVHTGYTGSVIDQNDIAVLTLSSAAPTFATGYELYTNDILGQNFNVNGTGTRSITGGLDGTTGLGAGAGPGRRRQGDNTFDLRLGEFFAPGGGADYEFSYLSDFDNGLAANDAACRNFGRCNLGRGATEVGIAGGDSGGGGFINGQLASINSYGVVFAGGVGDIKPGLQTSFGEFNGYVPVFIHTDFIAGVPEPATWAMLILGFGVIGGSLRRRTKAQFSFA